MSRHVHRMPFGAELVPGGVRFRLWAPAARRVELLLHDGPAASALDMPGVGAGWYELVTAAAAGARYRFRIDGALEVPDPASRCNPDDVHGPSMVVNPQSFDWSDDDWRGRPWHEAIVYELHVGTFSPEGTFAGVAARLDHLAALGVNTLELMPVAEFPGRHGWGYDGVLPFAPESAYGTPEDLKALVCAAHRRGLAVMLDVVYNHFGPEGNYLHAYAPRFFTERHRTPWGAAIDFDGAGSRTVRDFFIENALYWLGEYRLDGLRFDAVHAIFDDGTPHLLTELAERLRSGPGRERPRYLVLENDHNEARHLGPPGAPRTYDAQWADDEHHCLHVLLTGESDGYYGDYAEDPHALLARCLAEGFAYQGEVSAHSGRPRGEPSAHLPPTAFVTFLQNHDQIGNRAFGERLAQLVANERALLAATALVLLQPSPPMLFMGEEWAAPEPFPYFCDFGPELAAKVREGRRREFARFERFRDAAAWAAVPDPTDRETVRRARLDWSNAGLPRHARWLERHRRLLEIRRREIVPLVPRIRAARARRLGAGGALAADWTLDGGGRLRLLANLADGATTPGGETPSGRTMFTTHPGGGGAELPPWCVLWTIDTGKA